MKYEIKQGDKVIKTGDLPEKEIEILVYKTFLDNNPIDIIEYILSEGTKTYLIKTVYSEISNADYFINNYIKYCHGLHEAIIKYHELMVLDAQKEAS